jgi:hypothetical protein
MTVRSLSERASIAATAATSWHGLLQALTASRSSLFHVVGEIPAMTALGQESPSGHPGDKAAPPLEPDLCSLPFLIR